MAPTFLLLYAITNYKTVKLTQIDRIPAASCASPQNHVPITLIGIPYISLIYLDSNPVSIYRSFEGFTYYSEF